MTTPKSPEQIMEEFENLGELYALPKTLNGYSDITGTNNENGMRYRAMSVSRDLQDYFRSSMASLLCHMAERMPEKEEPLLDGGKRIEWHYGKSGMGDIEKFVNNGEIVGRNQGIDDCRTLLIEEARKILEK